MREAFLIGIAGMCGAILRTSIGVWMNEATTFPIATLSVNLVATWLLCFFAAGVLPKWVKSEQFQNMVTVGFLGSFSTFSALSSETVLLVENGDVMMAVMYVLVSMMGGIVIGCFGFYAGRKWQTS